MIDKVEAAGVNETMQIVRVTENGTESFFRISGKVLGTSSSIAKNITKVIAVIVKNARKKSLQNGEAYLNDMMNTASMTGEKVHAILMNKNIKERDFIDYANRNKLQYSIVDVGSDTVVAVYPGSQDKVIEEYVKNNRPNVTYTSIVGEVEDKTFDQINVNNKEKVKLYEGNIVAVDRNLQYVRVKLGTQSNPLYADMPAYNIKAGRDKSYYISAKRDDMFNCYTLDGARCITGMQMTQLMRDYQNSEEQELRSAIKKLSCPANQKNEFINDPLKYKNIINSMKWKEQYGSSKRVVSFFNGYNIKTMVSTGKHNASIAYSDAVKKAVQMKKR